MKIAGFVSLLIFMSFSSIDKTQGDESPVSGQIVITSASTSVLPQTMRNDMEQAMQQVRAAVAKHDYVASITHCLQILKTDPVNAEVHYTLAKALRLLHGNPQKCLYHAREAVRLEPSVLHRKELLDVLYLLKRYDEALQLGEELIGQTGDPTIRYNLALIHSHLGQRELMQAAFDSLLAERPDFVPALILAARDRVDRALYDEARPYIERALRLEPENLLAIYLNGRIALNRADYPTAAAAFETVIDHDAFHHHALFQLARAYNAMNRKDEALMVRRSYEAVKAMPEEERERNRQYLETHPDTVETHWTMGLLYLEINRGNLAARQFERVLELEPKHADALFSLAGIYMASSEYDKALPYLDRALECHPKPNAVRFTRALAYRGLKRLDDAVADCRAILKTEPNHVQARTLLNDLIDDEK